MTAVLERHNPYMTPPVKSPDPQCTECLGSGLDRDFGHNCVCVLDPAVFERSLLSQGREDLAPPARTLPRGDGTGTGHGRRADGPSEKQVGFYRRLLDDIAGYAKAIAGPSVTIDEEAAQTRRDELVSAFCALSVRDASVKIDETMVTAAGLKRQVHLTPGAAAVRPNRFPGRCQRCHVDVPAETGRIEQQAGRWVTFHLDGGCPQSAPTAAPTPVSPPQVPAGHYAVTSHGSNDLIFLRVDHGTGEYAGRVFGKFIVGGRPDLRIPSRQLPSLLARIVEEGVAAAGRRYGQEIGRCCLCNRELTDQASRAAGIGPDCANK